MFLKVFLYQGEYSNFQCRIYQVSLLLQSYFIPFNGLEPFMSFMVLLSEVFFGIVHISLLLLADVGVVIQDSYLL